MLLLIISIVAIIAIILSIIALTKTRASSSKSSTEPFINYPFGPINPEMVNPFVVQSVYGQPGSMFNLTTSSVGGADATLNMYQLQDSYMHTFVPEHKVNNGFNFGGNTTELLEMSKDGAWNNL